MGKPNGLPWCNGGRTPSLGTRRAVGATLASVLIFSSILISNLVLIDGSEERLRLSAVALQERTFSDEAILLGGLSILSILGKAQAIVSERTYQCSSVLNELTSQIQGLSVFTKKDGVTVDVTVTSVPAGDVREDYGLVRPFNGSQANFLGFFVSVNTTGAAPGGAVSLARVETHAVHLPVRVQDMTQFCTSAAVQLANGLRLLGHSLCASPPAYGDISGMADAISQRARSENLSVQTNVTLDVAPSCFVSYSILVTQSSVQGPQGNFSWTVEEQGSVAI